MSMRLMCFSLSLSNLLFETEFLTQPIWSKLTDYWALEILLLPCPSTGFMDVCCIAWLLYSCCKSKLRPSVLPNKFFIHWAILQHCSDILIGICILNVLCMCLHFYSFILCVGRNVPQGTHSGQRTNSVSQFSPFTLWMKPRLSNLVRAFLCLVILLTLLCMV